MVTIRPVQPGDRSEWLRMRIALWPDSPRQEHLDEMEEYAGSRPDRITFIAARPGGNAAGFLEASLRSYVDGCSTSPVGYLEGLWVDEDVRRQGLGERLVAAAEQWAIGLGCQEMGSDAEIENHVSLAAHLSYGYEQVCRVIQFRKSLSSGNPAEESG